MFNVKTQVRKLFLDYNPCSCVYFPDFCISKFLIVKTSYNRFSHQDKKECKALRNLWASWSSECRRCTPGWSRSTSCHRTWPRWRCIDCGGGFQLRCCCRKRRCTWTRPPTRKRGSELKVVIKMLFFD